MDSTSAMLMAAALAARGQPFVHWLPRYRHEPAPTWTKRGRSEAEAAERKAKAAAKRERKAAARRGRGAL